ncbi:MAG: hypothetical protein AAGD35_19745 [Actinomycetota bacterium]
MEGCEGYSEGWPDLEEAGAYQRLVRLARYRLRGHEHHAEDVVSRAVLKWRHLPADQRAVGRLEQVVKSEAFSFLRSEQRAKERDTRVTSDRSISGASAAAAADLRELRRAIAQTCQRHEIELTALDVEFFEQIVAGFSMADVARNCGANRYEVRKVRDKWRRILRQLAASNEVV